MDIRLARGLPQGVFALTAKAFRDQVVEVEVLFVIPVRVDACGLGKDVVPDDWLVGRDADPRKGGNQLANLVKGGFRYADLDLGHKVIQDSNYAGQWGIPGAFAHTVHRQVQAVDASAHGFHYICHAQVVVVVPVEIHMQLRIPFQDFVQVFESLRRRKYAKGIRQQQPVDGLGGQEIQEFKDVFL